MVHPRHFAKLKPLLRFAPAPRNFAATAAFCAIVAGLWIERPSLALIVPGSIVFACLAWRHLIGDKPNA